MSDGSPHWGSLEIGAQQTGRSSLRNMIKSERFVETRGDLPWFIAVHKPGRLTRR